MDEDAEVNYIRASTGTGDHVLRAAMQMTDAIGDSVAHFRPTATYTAAPSSPPTDMSVTTGRQRTASRGNLDQFEV